VAHGGTEVPDSCRVLDPARRLDTAGDIDAERTYQSDRVGDRLGGEAAGQNDATGEIRHEIGEQGVVERAAETIPTFLANRTKPIVIDERRNEVWDRSWVLYLFVAVLSMEWLSRKLLKLA